MADMPLQPSNATRATPSPAPAGPEPDCGASGIPAILEDLRAGRMVILVDDEDRENEGDLVVAAQCVTPEIVNFMLREARGVLCVALEPAVCDRLNLYPQATTNTATLGTAFTVSVDGHPRFGITTGVSAAERAKTIRLLMDPATQADDLARPGHIFPLRARAGGVLERIGQTEGSVDLARLAGLTPAAAIIEIMAEDGTMARRPQLDAFCAKHGLRICSVAELVQYRLRHETLITRLSSHRLRLDAGTFDLHVYQTQGDPLIHVALTCGPIGRRDGAGRAVLCPEPTLVRMHTENLLGDVFGVSGAQTAQDLRNSLAMIQAAGRGALVYLRQESRGLALLDHLRHLTPTGTLAAPDASALPGEAAASQKEMQYRRDLGIGAQILRDLGLTQLRVLTNHPKQHHAVEAFGLRVVEQVPIAAPT
jgi:3,4-dihydroxy 2-butanone 4-phosphate synthase/GTP cyclohydrolase II